jgi:hypothetical protein
MPQYSELEEIKRLTYFSIVSESLDVPLPKLRVLTQNLSTGLLIDEPRAQLKCKNFSVSGFSSRKYSYKVI